MAENAGVPRWRQRCKDAVRLINWLPTQQACSFKEWWYFGGPGLRGTTKPTWINPATKQNTEKFQTCCRLDAGFPHKEDHEQMYFTYICISPMGRVDIKTLP